MGHCYDVINGLVSCARDYLPNAHNYARVCDVSHYSIPEGNVSRYTWLYNPTRFACYRRNTNVKSRVSYLVETDMALAKPFCKKCMHTSRT